MKIRDLAGGMVLGAASAGVGGVKLLQTQLMKEIPSPKSFEETCKAIEETVPQFAEKGWGFPFNNWNFHKVFEDKNIDIPDIKKMTVYFICNAKLAAKMINANNAIVGIMPCSWAVLEKSDGKTYIAKINMNVLANIFLGPTKEAMLQVEKDEEEMFEKIFS